MRRYLARRLLSDLKRAEASLRQVKQIPPTNYRRMSDPARFKGGVLEPTGSTQPSRALRAQIHKSGASEALPGEVRAVLGRTLSARSGADARAEPLDMGLELRDERSVNEVVVQFLAFTPGDRSRNGWPKSVYFTFQVKLSPRICTRFLRKKAVSLNGQASSGAAVGMRLGNKKNFRLLENEVLGSLHILRGTAPKRPSKPKIERGPGLVRQLGPVSGYRSSLVHGLERASARSKANLEVSSELSSR